MLVVTPYWPTPEKKKNIFMKSSPFQQPWNRGQLVGAHAGRCLQLKEPFTCTFGNILFGSKNRVPRSCAAPVCLRFSHPLCFLSCASTHIYQLEPGGHGKACQNSSQSRAPMFNFTIHYALSDANWVEKCCQNNVRIRCSDNVHQVAKCGSM